MNVEHLEKANGSNRLKDSEKKLKDSEKSLIAKHKF
jgi:hypothetical protein